MDHAVYHCIFRHRTRQHFKKRAEQMKKEQMGILQMIVCAVLWSTAGIFIKMLPWHGFAVAGLRSLIAGITIAAYMAVRRYRFILNRKTMMAGCFAGLNYICFATANKMTTAANAIVLQFTSPVFILIFSALFLRQKIRKGDLAVVVTVLGGIALFFLDQLGPSTAAGNCLALTSGMLMAGMYVTVGNIELEERFSGIVIGQAVAFLVGLPMVFMTKPVMNAVTVSSILALGVFQLGIAYVLFVCASAKCSALACCLLGAVEPLLNPVWVMIFDGETPGVFALIGGVIVIAAVTVWGVWDGKQKEAAQA